MSASDVMLITGTSKGIGKFLAEYYLARGYQVVGCSRGPSDLSHAAYRHFELDVADEAAVKRMITNVQQTYQRIDILVNNAGIASMNYAVLTPLSTVESIFKTNVYGTFLFMREAAKVMMLHRYGRIVNLVSVARPLKLEGEAIYAASKSAVETLTQILARELASFGITCNAVGPTPVATDLIGSVPKEKIDRLIDMQAVKRLGEFRDIANVIDFFIKKESDFVTGQVVYLGGI